MYFDMQLAESDCKIHHLHRLFYAQSAKEIVKCNRPFGSSCRLLKWESFCSCRRHKLRACVGVGVFTRV
jgi:hypothetical protein